MGQYHYRITHYEHGAVDVIAEDRLRAVCAAAHAWGVRWTSIARECGAERLGPAADPTAENRKGEKTGGGRTARKGKAERRGVD